jgi:RHS repeat-associated protein
MKTMPELEQATSLNLIRFYSHLALPVYQCMHLYLRAYFEINNYLGNMNVVITDRRTLANPAPGASTWEAVVISNSDYYPFGMQMPGRSNAYGAGVEYRYAYNGMETDGEVSGDGNSYTTEFRQYDPRLGRWKSLDPLMAKYPSESPYFAFNNNPIFYIDPLGLEGKPVPEEKDWTEVPEVEVKGNRINKAYYENNKGFVIEKNAGGKAMGGGGYLGNQKPSNVDNYHLLIFKDNKLVHKNVHNQAIVLWNYIWGTNLTTNKDYDPAEESFSAALVEFTAEWAVGFGLGKLFKGSAWLWNTMKKRGGSLWGGASIGRGFVYEEMIGANLRHIKGYNVIDDFANGVATSVKTLKLSSKGYIDNPKRVYNKLKGYIDELASFNGVNKGGVNTINKITSRKIELAIPKNATKEQIEMIEKAVQYAQDKGVTLNVRAIR